MKTKTIVEKRRSITLKIQGDTLIIKRPIGIDDKIVNAFVQKKKTWIDSQLRFNQLFNISFNEPLIVFNQPISLKYKKSSMHQIVKDHQQWVVFSPTESSAIQAVKHDLKLLLLNKIETQLKTLQVIKPFEVSRVILKNLKSSWGNCNSKKELSFAFRLIHLKPSFIDSVIAHEVSHLFEMNHSKAFYRVLYQFDPNYRSSIKDPSDL